MKYNEQKQMSMDLNVVVSPMPREANDLPELDDESLGDSNDEHKVATTTTSISINDDVSTLSRTLTSISINAENCGSNTNIRQD